MEYERFKQLWDIYIGDRITKINASPETITALIEYGQGNTTKIDSIRNALVAKLAEHPT